MPTFQGKIVSVQKDENTGYYRIGTDGTPKRLDTKREELAREAVRLMREGSVNVIQYNSNQRHDPGSGRTYTNNYYEGLLAAGGGGGDGGNGGTYDPLADIPTTGGTQQDAAPWDSDVTPTSDFQRPMDPESVWRICLTAGAKLAVQTLPLMPSEQRDFDTQRQIALAWAQWIVNTPRPSSDMGFGVRSTAEQARGMGAYSAPQGSEEFGF